MQQILQDALAIDCHYNSGNLFLTMTANPAWPEIHNALEPGQNPADCPDLAKAEHESTHG